MCNNDEREKPTSDCGADCECVCEKGRRRSKKVDDKARHTGDSKWDFERNLNYPWWQYPWWEDQW